MVKGFALKDELRKICKACFGSQNKAAEVIFFKENDALDDNEDELKQFKEKFKKQVNERSQTDPDILEYYVGLLLNDGRCNGYKLSKATIENLPRVQELKRYVSLLRGVRQKLRVKNTRSRSALNGAKGLAKRLLNEG